MLNRARLILQLCPIQGITRRYSSLQTLPKDVRLHSLSARVAEQHHTSTLPRQGGRHKAAELDTNEDTAFQTFLKNGARVTRAAHVLLDGIVKPGDFVVDATCGNGSDTLWLSRAVGPSGRVLAFDLQAEAIKATTDLLEWELPRESWPELSILKKCHSELKAELNGAKPKLVCFNLGYLPWTDKSIMTLPQTTTAALQAALECLDSHGVVSIISYIGHDGGQAEHDAVSETLSKLDSQYWTVMTSKVLNRALAPILFIAARK